MIGEKDECYFCKTTLGLEKHHIFGSSNRKNSEQDGLTVMLCARCHRSNTGVHFDWVKMEHLHKVGQLVYEQTHSREDFMKRYGRNYL